MAIAIYGVALLVIALIGGFFLNRWYRLKWKGMSEDERRAEDNDMSIW